uniref:Ig-like domain-containing protein n=1 Tax=Haplochromis burtoni TaxID=8153 RepID=A0A3Q2V6B3_HAPBU
MSSALQQDVQAKPGACVTLQCEISTDEIISVLKWSRADLNTDGYVYFYRNKRFYENYQHPSFHGRVKLRDPEMKDGDVSLILKNVAFNDTGMYECHIAVRNPVRSKRAHTEISHFINLTVTGEFVELIKCKLTTSSALYDPVRTLSTCDLISVYSAGETHESVASHRLSPTCVMKVSGKLHTVRRRNSWYFLFLTP